MAYLVYMMNAKICRSLLTIGSQARAVIVMSGQPYEWPEPTFLLCRRSPRILFLSSQMYVANQKQPPSIRLRGGVVYISVSTDNCVPHCMPHVVRTPSYKQGR